VPHKSKARVEKSVTGPSQAALQKNIFAVSALEQEALAKRSYGERLGDHIARFAGKIWFIWFHAAWFGFWVGWNCSAPRRLRFDPYPFQFLTLVVSLEAIFLSLFILISQNRANRQADARAHLDLQINMLAEQESTKTLQLLQSLCRHHGLPEAKDPDLQILKTPTAPEDLMHKLEESLPEDS
jgi:uncharacterized membrane protein